MADYYLPIFRKNAYLELAELLPALLAQPKFDQLVSFAQAYRIKACGFLFADFDPHLCLHDLSRSGRAFLFALPKIDPKAYVVSRAEAFFDAIAANDQSCAADLAGYLAKGDFQRNFEYEEDYLYYQFLFHFFFLKSEAAVCRGFLDRIEAVIEGAEYPRLDICTAFMDDEAEDFEDAFTLLLDEREAFYRAKREDESLTEELLLTEGKFFVEGLALLRLAERKGFPVQDEYLFVPSPVRRDISASFDADSWRTTL
ncbi:Immunity 49 family protein [Sulfidibacter corallicola]|uniref:Immunity 49 family protein n=1 Tax=Sulfidibacter corallicola TaxID=2818388 RepID=A0A8A4TRF5_SULCO|nr:Imm49 family immunity protein [Sulfidibacter corallicola]QTD51598.1 immunity 49 family protein [Sulfidibacter corallicola]